jgi:hypothetical protein
MRHYLYAHQAGNSYPLPTSSLSLERSRQLLQRSAVNLPSRHFSRKRRESFSRVTYKKEVHTFVCLWMELSANNISPHHLCPRNDIRRVIDILAAQCCTSSALDELCDASTGLERCGVLLLSCCPDSNSIIRVLQHRMRRALSLCKANVLLCTHWRLSVYFHPKAATRRTRQGITGSHTESGRWVGPPYRGPQHHVWECAFLCELAHSGRGARFGVQGRPWNGEGPRMDTGAWERHAHNLLGQVLAVGEGLLFKSAYQNCTDL